MIAPPRLGARQDWPPLKGAGRSENQVEVPPVDTLTCPRFLYQPKVEFPWVDHTPFVALRTLPPFALISAAL